MKKVKTFLVCAFLAFVFLFAVDFAQADGMVVAPDPYADRWDFVEENSQRAVIDFDGMREQMFVAIDLEKNVNGAVWLFPVPSAPEKVQLDIERQFPDISGGEDIRIKAKKNLHDAWEWNLLTQPYILPFGIFNMGMAGSVQSVDDGGFSSAREVAETDVMVHEHIEKHGVTSELITAKTGDGIYKYLQEKKLNIKKGDIQELEGYIGHEYSFVVSWITGNLGANASSGGIAGSRIKTEQEREKTENSRAVSVNFPTPMIYFPLVPTSVYGDKIIPISVKISGFVDVSDFSDSLGVRTKVQYFKVPEVVPDEWFPADKSEIQKNFNKYTKITINAPAKYLITDLWAVDEPPRKTHLYEYLGQYSLILVFAHIFAVLLLSVVSSLVVGMIVFKEQRTQKGAASLALLGFHNILTILAVGIKLAFEKTKPDNERGEEIVLELKKRGYFLKRRIGFVLLLVLGIMFFVTVPLLIVSFYFEEYRIIAFGIMTVYAFGVWYSLRIKPEDKELFRDLKQCGYSDKTFVPKDSSRKPLYFMLFSGVFISISYFFFAILSAII